MRADQAGTINISTTGQAVAQPTLTAEAATILKQAVREACKRGHVQVTPLHVAASLLASPNSPLRRACLQTHDVAVHGRAALHSSPHLPQCRALDLCFNIALERLQATHAGPGPPACSGAGHLTVPSYSNALTAALKRAQAHQRRGCPPDQQLQPQQQPLFAVKVELQQLIISILDDPSVSRVMREAGFRSTDVKRQLEEMSTAQQLASHVSIFSHHLADAAGRQQPFMRTSANAMDHMTSTAFSCVNGGILPTQSILGAGFPLSHHLARFSIPDCSVPNTQGRIDMQHHGLRPLSWFHDSPHQSPMELLKLGGINGAPAAEPANLSARSTSGEVAGTDSLALSLVLRSSDPLSKLMSSIPQHIIQGTGGDEHHKLTCCSECSKNYEKEALLLRQDHPTLKQLAYSPRSCSSASSIETPSKAVNEYGSYDQPVLPLWLQKALSVDGSKRASTATAVEVYDKPVPKLAKGFVVLRKKWNRACKCLHSERLQAGWEGASNMVVEMRQVQQSICRPQLYVNQVCGNRPSQGRTLSLLEGNCSGQAALSPVPSTRLRSRMNPEALGELCKGLAKKVGWQPRVISTIANTLLQCRSGLGKRIGAGSWLFFLGHDRPGKRLMAEALAELSFAEVEKKFAYFTFGCKQQQQQLEVAAVGSPTLSWSLGLSAPSPRGKMPVDELADAVRHNPSSLFYLEDVEQADPVFRSSLLRAISTGRLIDGSGRDVSFSSAIVVMTSNVGMDHSCLTEEKVKLTPQSANEDCANSHASSILAADERQQGRYTALRKRKRSWDDANVESKDGSQPITSKRAKNYTLDLDLNLAVETDNYIGSTSPVSHLSVRDTDFLRSTSVDQPLVRAIDEKAVLSGARKQLGALCDLVDVAVVFAPRP